VEGGIEVDLGETHQVFQHRLQQTNAALTLHGRTSASRSAAAAVNCGTRNPASLLCAQDLCSIR
jgi:hypothetical protein